MAGERITGSAGNDTLTGTDNNDVFFGLDGDDVIAGAGDDDILDGGNGGDVLEGGDGNDNTLIAGVDGMYDYLYGGADNDVYLFGRNAGGGYIDDEDGDADIVRFDATVSAADVKVSRDFSDLYLSVDGMGDRIDLAGGSIERLSRRCSSRTVRCGIKRICWQKSLQHRRMGTTSSPKQQQTRYFKVSVAMMLYMAWKEFTCC